MPTFSLFCFFNAAALVPIRAAFDACAYPIDAAIGCHTFVELALIDDNTSSVWPIHFAYVCGHTVEILEI